MVLRSTQNNISMDTNNTSQKPNSLGIIFDTPKTPKGGFTLPEKNPASYQNNSHLSSHGDVFDVTKIFQSEHGETGTIISDRKRQRQSFGGILKNAFDEWWGNAKIIVEKAVEESPMKIKEEPTVAKAETRTEVVREAVKHSTIAPKDDHHAVLEQFHTLKEDVARIPGAPNIIIKQPVKSASGFWTNFTNNTVPEKPSLQVTVEPLDLRSSVIAPDVTRKIIADIHEYAPQNVPQTKPVLPVHTAQQKPVPMMVVPIPDIAPKMEGTVPQAKFVPPTPVAPVKPKETIPVLPKVTIPPLVQTLPQREVQKATVVPLPQHIAKPLNATPHPAVDISDTYEARASKEVVIPEPVKPPQREVPEVNSSVTRIIEPIHSSEAMHVFHSVRENKKNSNETQGGGQTPFALTFLFDIPKVVWFGIGGVILGGVLILSAVGIYFKFFQSAPVQTYTIASFCSVDTTVGVPLTENRETLHTLFSEQLSVPGMQSVQVYPTVQEGESLRPATSKEFFTALGTHIPRALLNSLDNAFMVGGIKTTAPEPYLIIRSYNFDELFAGLLNWEKTMIEDLSPLFGTLSATSASFTDAVQNNKSTRILYDTNGKEVLLYSFISQDMVIITTSGEALSALLRKF